MPAFLALIPFKDWCYLGVIMAILAGFGWYTYHERSIGAAKVVAADAKLVAAIAQRDAALQTTAALADSIAQGNYTHEISVPVTDAPVPVGLCDNSPDPLAMPAAADSGKSGITEAARSGQDASAVTKLQHFADAAVEIARDDDAQIDALQTIIMNLRTEMEQANVRR